MQIEVEKITTFTSEEDFGEDGGEICAAVVLDFDEDFFFVVFFVTGSSGMFSANFHRSISSLYSSNSLEATACTNFLTSGSVCSSVAQRLEIKLDNSKKPIFP